MTALLVMLFPALIGLLVIWHVVRPQRPPADASNRINKIRMIWYALTREDELARVIDWLRGDESDVAPLPVTPTDLKAAVCMYAANPVAPKRRIKD